MRELYVYYRVPEDAADAAAREVATLHTELRASWPIAEAPGERERLAGR